MHWKCSQYVVEINDVSFNTYLHAFAEGHKSFGTKSEFYWKHSSTYVNVWMNVCMNEFNELSIAY